MRWGVAWTFIPGLTVDTVMVSLARLMASSYYDISMNISREQKKDK